MSIRCAASRTPPGRPERVFAANARGRRGSGSGGGVLRTETKLGSSVWRTNRRHWRRSSCVASVLRRPSSVALNLCMCCICGCALGSVKLPGASFGYGRPSHVQARERERGSSRSSQHATRSSTFVLEEQRKCNTSVRLGCHSHYQMVCV